jgi:hypothetical protein
MISLVVLTFLGGSSVKSGMENISNKYYKITCVLNYPSAFLPERILSPNSSCLKVFTTSKGRVTTAASCIFDKKVD